MSERYHFQCGNCGEKGVLTQAHKPGCINSREYVDAQERIASLESRLEAADALAGAVEERTERGWSYALDAALTAYRESAK